MTATTIALAVLCKALIMASYEWVTGRRPISNDPLPTIKWKRYAHYGFVTVFCTALAVVLGFIALVVIADRLP